MEEGDGPASGGGEEDGVEGLGLNEAAEAVEPGADGEGHLRRERGRERERERERDRERDIYNKEIQTENER